MVLVFQTQLGYIGGECVLPPRAPCSKTPTMLYKGVVNIQRGREGPREPTLFKDRFIWEWPSTEHSGGAIIGDATVSKAGHVPAGGRAAANRFVWLKVLVLFPLSLSTDIAPGLPAERVWKGGEARGGRQQLGAWPGEESELGGQAGCWADTENSLSPTQDTAR